MPGYYSKKLAAERLRACYELAPPRTSAYLEAEIGFVLGRTAPGMRVLELGCGYGRVLQRLTGKVRMAVGIDTSHRSLRLAQEALKSPTRVCLAVMDASRMAFTDHVFDLTICVQNGIAAFGVSQQRLFSEAVRVTRPGGTVLFSSYASRFWEDRLAWFEVQAAHGLIGEIDHRATGDGVIVCKDGFRATAVSPEAFRSLAASLDLVPTIVEVDGSSLFCELVVPRGGPSGVLRR